jgi:hypothetical protein
VSEPSEKILLLLMNIKIGSNYFFDVSYTSNPRFLIGKRWFCETLSLCILKMSYYTRIPRPFLLVVSCKINRHFPLSLSCLLILKYFPPPASEISEKSFTIYTVWSFFFASTGKNKMALFFIYIPVNQKYLYFTYLCTEYNKLTHIFFI